MSEIGWCDRQ